MTSLLCRLHSCILQYTILYALHSFLWYQFVSLISIYLVKNPLFHAIILNFIDFYIIDFQLIINYF